MIRLDVNGVIWDAEMHISNMINDRLENDLDWECLAKDGFGCIDDAWVIRLPRRLRIWNTGSDYDREKNEKDAVDTGGAYYRVHRFDG